MMKSLYLLHTIFVYFIAFISTALFSALAIIAGVFNPYSNLSNLIVKAWAASILKASGVKLIIEGIENINLEKSYVYMANHIGAFDILVLVKAIPQTARFIAKKELFKIPLLAQGMRMSGMLEIDRGNSDKARQTLKKAIKTIQDGCSVIIFPEGTRSIDGKLQNFKKGGFILSIDGKIPIIPTVIMGTQYIFPKGSKWLKSGTAKVKFLNEVEVKNYNYESRNALVKSTHDQIGLQFISDFNRN